MPTPRAGASGSSDDPFQLRGNAPVSVVRAAKASLKEPTRPVTPADYGRQLFSSGDPSNRPSTSYSVSGSKAFYQDGAGPKLALPKLETGRLDTSGGGALRKAPSGAEREPSRAALSDMDPITERYAGPPPGVQDLGNGAQGSSEEFAAWRASIEAVLSELSAAISSKAATSVLCAAAGRLVGLVEEVRRREHSSAWLNSACSAGSGFRDAGGVALTLREAACAVVLRVVKSRQPLLQTAKLLYRLSKDGGNDGLFRREGLLEPLVHTGHIMVASARGSSNPANMHEASGVLRNLAVPAQNAPAFLAAGVLPALRAAVSCLSGQVEVVLNAGRILSKLTLHDGCQDAIAADPGYAPLLVCNVPFALVTVVGILQRYAYGGGPQPEGGAAAGGSAAADRLSKAASHEDCLVKVLRLAANLAIWPDAGRTLAEEEHVAGALLALLERYSFEAAEELVLNTVCALTNLSFYQSEQQPGGFTNRVLLLPPPRLLPRITPLLLCDNEEAVVEAARVYGNFSRSADVRDYMQATRVVEALVLLLDHSNAEVLYSVCGTLINFTMDGSRRDVLGGLGGVSRLVEVLGRTMAQGELGEREEAIVEVVCKALFNVAFRHEEVVEVLGLLEVLEASSLGEAAELGAVLGRLGGQMRRLQARLSLEELEALPDIRPCAAPVAQYAHPAIALHPVYTWVCDGTVGKLPPDKVISTNKLGAEERERRRAQRMTAEVSHMSPVQMPGGHKQRTAATAVCSTP
eukprot:XP_001702811.1 predicted protein [Chlamydomonas reinhardtii]